MQKSVKSAAYLFVHIGVDYLFWGQELGNVEPLVGQVHGFGGVLDGSVRVPVFPIRTQSRGHRVHKGTNSLLKIAKQNLQHNYLQIAERKKKHLINLIRSFNHRWRFWTGSKVFILLNFERVSIFKKLPFCKIMKKIR